MLTANAGGGKVWKDLLKYCYEIGLNFFEANIVVNKEAYAKLPQLRPIIFGLMARCEAVRLGGVLMTKLPAGGLIEPHIDFGWHAKTYDKFYVAVKTPARARFTFPDGDICARDGEVYWFRNDVEHSVHNGGPGDRIALIVCIQLSKGPAW